MPLPKIIFVGKDQTTAELNFSIANTPLGLMLVARNQVGICTICLGDKQDNLIATLKKRFPKNKLVNENNSTAITKVLSAMKSSNDSTNFILDMKGTPFQQKVWQALKKIPYGSTKTYSEIAKQMGSPRAVRAVANACGANPIAIIIPCHRVVRTDGSLSGYRWGVERKRALLEMESK